MAESQIEAYLRDEVKKIGGRAYKFVSPGNRGVPDRLVCLPGGRVFFVETKDAGKKSTSLQKGQQRILRAMGFKVYADADADSKAGIDEILRREAPNEIHTA